MEGEHKIMPLDYSNNKLMFFFKAAINGCVSCVFTFRLNKKKGEVGCLVVW
jgi:hypothetical protein